MNKMYVKGANNERQLVNSYRKKGCFALRSAGSHSDVDVIAIENNELHLIQVKGKKQKITIPIEQKQLIVRKFLAYKIKGKWRFDEL